MDPIEGEEISTLEDSHSGEVEYRGMEIAQSMKFLNWLILLKPPDGWHGRPFGGRLNIDCPFFSSGVIKGFGKMQLRGKTKFDKGKQSKVEVQRTWSQRWSHDKVKRA